MIHTIYKHWVMTCLEAVDKAIYPDKGTMDSQYYAQLRPKKGARVVIRVS